MFKRWRSRTFAAGTILAFIVATVSGFAVGGGTATAAGLTLSPTALTFAPTTVGDFDYQMVTITNGGAEAEYISTATTSGNPPFFPTYGGTCNFSVDETNKNYYIPAGESCTFQWGFHPARPGKQMGTGTLYFDSGATLTVTFTGKGTPH